MRHKFEDIDIKKHTYYFFHDIINIQNFDPNKFIQKHSYLLHWIYDNQRLEIPKN